MEATSREPVQIDNLVVEYARNKEEADKLTQRNRLIATQLAAVAQYKPGSESGHIEAAGFKVTVVKKINETWDQERLNQVRSEITDTAFLPMFRFKWEPKAKELKTFLAMPGSDEIKAALLSARTIKPGTPSVKLEVM